MDCAWCNASCDKQSSSSTAGSIAAARAVRAFAYLCSWHNHLGIRDRFLRLFRGWWSKGVEGCSVHAMLSWFSALSGFDLCFAALVVVLVPCEFVVRRSASDHL